MKKKGKTYYWIISDNPLADNSTTLVSQHNVPITFVFSIRYSFLSWDWYCRGLTYKKGWRFGCNMWFGGKPYWNPQNYRTITTAGLYPYYDQRGHMFGDQQNSIRASFTPYATEAECIEAAIRHVVARLDITLAAYPDIVYHLLRPECDAFFKLWQTLLEKEAWLDEVRSSKGRTGLTKQAELF